MLLPHLSCTQVPNVAMSPPLEDIQAAINECAKKVLQSSKLLPCWGQPEFTSFHDLIAGDKEIVKSILRLTGSVEGIKMQVGPAGTAGWAHTCWPMPAAWTHQLSSNLWMRWSINGTCWC